jgi:hypothetical protein
MNYQFASPADLTCGFYYDLDVKWENNSQSHRYIYDTGRLFIQQVY